MLPSTNLPSKWAITILLSKISMFFVSSGVNDFNADVQLCKSPLRCVTVSPWTSRLADSYWVQRICSSGADDRVPTA